MLSRRNETNPSLVGELRVGEMRVGEMRRSFEQYNKGIMHIRKFLHNWLLQSFASNKVVLSCSQRGKKIVWSTAYSIFVSCGLKIGDTMSLKLYYVMSYKA